MKPQMQERAKSSIQPCQQAEPPIPLQKADGNAQPGWEKQQQAYPATAPMATRGVSRHRFPPAAALLGYKVYFCPLPSQSPPCPE